MSASSKNALKPGPDDPSPVPGFFRRLAAFTYDLLLLIAVLFFATAVLLPFHSGNAFTSQQFYFRIYLIVVSFLFYGWFWTHGGQTLGMRAWKLQVVSTTQLPLTWKQALLRFITALCTLGLGFLWVLIDKNRQGWHDHLSKTRVLFAPKTQ